MSRARRWLDAMIWALVPSVVTQILIDGFSIRPLNVVAWMPFWTFLFWYYDMRRTSDRRRGG